MVFYAYSKTSQDDVHWRYLIVAPNMEILDEWYRAIEAKLPAGSITRISPEFYVHDHTKVDLGRSTWKTNQTPEFMNWITFTLLNDVVGREYVTFYNRLATNHVSGNSFYIRSKSNPSVFWHEIEGRIIASKDERTKFRITARDLDRNAVMIKDDSVSISSVFDGNLSVSVSYGGGLVLGRKGEEFKFSELKTGFLSSAHGSETRVTRVNDDGEEWELVA